MKIQIMINILFLLLSRKNVSAKYIANRFDVCLRSVYRYIDCLSLAGVPIYTQRGRNGGFCIFESYRLPSNFFSEKEFNLIINALNTLKGVNNNEVSLIIDKMGTLNNRYLKEENLSLNNVIIDGGGWSVNENYREKLNILMNSIENQNVIYVSYHDRGGKTSERFIEPHLLILKQGLWYIYAYCRLRKAFRFFKIGRIASIKVIEEKFEKRSIDKDKIYNSNWYENVEIQDVDLQVKRYLKSDIEEWLGVTNVSENQNGDIFASCKLPIDKGLIAKLLSFGNGIKVLSPESLVKEMKTTVEDLIKSYS